MLFGAMYFGYIVGTVASILAAKNTRQNRFFQDMQDLNEFMQEGRFPQRLRVQLRECVRSRAVNHRGLSASESLLITHMFEIESDFIAL